MMDEALPEGIREEVGGTLGAFVITDVPRGAPGRGCATIPIYFFPVEDADARAYALEQAKRMAEGKSPTWLGEGETRDDAERRAREETGEKIIPDDPFSAIGNRHLMHRRSSNRHRLMKILEDEGRDWVLSVLFSGARY